MCYRENAWDRQDWLYDGNPRKLALGGHIGYAKNNVDNFVVWGLRRFRTFGLCTYPNLILDEQLPP